MSDWYGTSRSNYFMVKDVDKFKTLCARWGVEFIEKDAASGFVGFLGMSEYGGLPSCRLEKDKDTDEMIELDSDDFYTELADQLKDGEVAVLMEAGAQKHAYITGFAMAINSKGENVSLSLNEIYEKAKGLGENITMAEH